MCTCLCPSVWVVMSLQIRGPRVLFLGCCLLCFVFAVGYLTCFGTQQSVQLVPGICPSLPSWHWNCDHAWLFHISSGFKLVFLYSNTALSKQPPQPSILLFFWQGPRGGLRYYARFLPGPFRMRTWLISERLWRGQQEQEPASLSLSELG